MDVLSRKSALVLCICGATALPGSLMAGAYGNSAVKDAGVSNQAAAEGKVWCETLGQAIPESLVTQMDCGGAPARAVSRQRSGIVGFISKLKVVPDTTPEPDDGDGPKVVRVSNPPSNEPNDPPVTSSGPVDKWERLNELNVTPDNFLDQGHDFVQEVKDFSSANGPGGDWSGFNPSSN